MKKKEKKIEVLSNWEWTTLVAAWRYYELRATIASATFPEDVVRRFWGSGKYSDSVLRQIANQFANIDHGRDGESYWTKDRTIGDCDRKSWCVFYAFCKGWCEGFTTVVLDATFADVLRLGFLKRIQRTDDKKETTRKLMEKYRKDPDRYFNFWLKHGFTESDRFDTNDEPCLFAGTGFSESDGKEEDE